jgi:hypothetical protein
MGRTISSDGREEELVDHILSTEVQVERTRFTVRRCVRTTRRLQQTGTHTRGSFLGLPSRGIGSFGGDDDVASTY